MTQLVLVVNFAATRLFRLVISPSAQLAACPCKTFWWLVLRSISPNLPCKSHAVLQAGVGDDMPN